MLASEEEFNQNGPDYNNETNAVSARIVKNFRIR